MNREQFRIRMLAFGYSEIEIAIMIGDVGACTKTKGQRRFAYRNLYNQLIKQAHTPVDVYSAYGIARPYHGH